MEEFQMKRGKFSSRPFLVILFSVGIAILSTFLVAELLGLTVTVTNMIAILLAGMAVYLGQIRIRRLRETASKAERSDTEKEGTH